jgi:catechol 2,3-dioxygenase
MVDWYGAVAGMRANHHDSSVGAWLSNDAANHRIALLAFPDIPEDADKLAHPGLHHLAFEFATLAELLQRYAQLREEGIVPHACLDHGMTISLYYADPDGNSVELQADNFGGDWAASSEWMRTAPQFTANPIGAPFDPAALLDAWHAGADADELHRRAYAGEFDPGTPLDLRLPPPA